MKDYAFGEGRIVLIAVGKAEWQMANAVRSALGDACTGLVITKYGHVREDIPGIECFEAGHPIPDENGITATKKAIEMVKILIVKDQVIFLLPGGGSALFENF